MNLVILGVGTDYVLFWMVDAWCNFFVLFWLVLQFFCFILVRDRVEEKTLNLILNPRYIKISTLGSKPLFSICIFERSVINSN